MGKAGAVVTKHGAILLLLKLEILNFGLCGAILGEELLELLPFRVGLRE